MTKSNLILLAAIAIFSNFAHAQDAENTGPNSSVEDLMGADDAGFDPGAPASSAGPKTASNPALDRLDTIKISDSEIMTFMKSGGLKSRILK